MSNILEQYEQQSELSSLVRLQIQNFWSADEINYANDVVYLRNLSQENITLLCDVMQFFLFSDEIISFDISLREFSSQIVRYNVSFQEMMEHTHDLSYRKQIKTITTALPQCAPLFDINKKHTFACFNKFLFMQRELVAIEDSLSKQFTSSLIESLFFTTCFNIIYYFKSLNLIPSIVQANEFIAVDEALHVDLGCEILKLNNFSYQDIHCRIIDGIMDTELEFIEKILHGNKSLTVQKFKNQCFNNLNYFIRKSKFPVELFQEKSKYAYILEKKFETYSFVEAGTRHTRTHFFEKKSTAYKRYLQNDIDF